MNKLSTLFLASEQGMDLWHEVMSKTTSALVRRGVWGHASPGNVLDFYSPLLGIKSF